MQTSIQHLWNGSRLALIDHGFAFPHARGRHFHDVFWNARLRTEPKLDVMEQTLMQKLADSSDLLGLEKMLPQENAAALRDRARRMAETGDLPYPQMF